MNSHPTVKSWPSLRIALCKAHVAVVDHVDRAFRVLRGSGGRGGDPHAALNFLHLEHNALLMVTVEADFGGGKMTLPGARLYLLDEDKKIKVEQVVFRGS